VQKASKDLGAVVDALNEVEELRRKFSQPAKPEKPTK